MLLSSRNVTVETRQFSSSRGPDTVEDIFVEDKYMRVFILNMYSLFASRILCKVSYWMINGWVRPCSLIWILGHNNIYTLAALLWATTYNRHTIRVCNYVNILFILQAYHNGMYHPNYVWITYSWYNSEWWQRSKGNHNCTDEEMHHVLKRSLSVTQYPVTNTSKETDSGLVRHMLEEIILLSCSQQLSTVWGRGWGDEGRSGREKRKREEGVKGITCCWST